MKPEHEARRKIIREWMSLPKDKRQTEEQAKPFAKKAMERMCPSHSAIVARSTPLRKLVIRHARSAATECPLLAAKKVGVHTLRHTCAMTLLRSGVDLATIALWLGHEDLRTVQVYLHADLELKERALARTAPPGTTPGDRKSVV